MALEEIDIECMNNLVDLYQTLKKKLNYDDIALGRLFPLVVDCITSEEQGQNMGDVPQDAWGDIPPKLITVYEDTDGKLYVANDFGNHDGVLFGYTLKACTPNL